MASRDKKDLHNILVSAFDKALPLWIVRYPTFSTPFLTCTYRSNEEQEYDFQQGRTRTGPVITWAHAGQSPHNYKPSLAFDIAFLSQNGKGLDWTPNLFLMFEKLLKEVEPLVIWGADWDDDGNLLEEKRPDRPHYQLKNWQNYLPVKDTV